MRLYDAISIQSKLLILMITMIAEVGRVGPNIEVMCIVKSLKFEAVCSICVLLALLYDRRLVSLLFLDVIGTVAGTAIPTSHFIF